MIDDDRWLDVAGAILDGTAVPWDEVGERDGAADRISADSLRLIEEVVLAHRRLAAVQGTHWGPLEILENVGHGTFGDVFRAYDPALDRDVALKLFAHTRLAAAADEGKLLARVRHPNVVTVHGAAVHAGRYGIWMEFIRGRTLAAIVAEDGSLEAAEAARVGIDVCHALSAVHHAGLLHGDVKAQNVMREDGGRTVLMDFGTGRCLEDADRTRLAGTPLYLAPEVLGGAAADARSDLYSVGILLYYLLTGAFPVEGSSLEEVRGAHAARRRTPLCARRGDVPSGILAIVERVTSADPAMRFDSAAALAHGLADAAAKNRPASARRTMTPVAVGIAAAALAGIGWWGASSVRAKASAAATVTTGSAEALRLYDASYELGFRGDWQSALALARQAVAADETFALAHAWDAWCLRNTGAPAADVIAEGRRAVDLSPRVMEWERLWIRASLAAFTDDADGEIAALTALVKVRPDHYWAVNNLAIRLRAVGRSKDALPYVVRLADLRPADGISAVRAAQDLMTAGDTATALVYAGRARTIAGEHGWFTGASVAWTLSIEALWRRGDVRAAAAALDDTLAECTRLDPAGRLELAKRLVSMNLSLGRWRAATAAADVMPNPSERHFNRAIAAFHGGARSTWLSELAAVSADASGLDSRVFYLVEAARLDVAQWDLDHAVGKDRGGLDVERGRIAMARGDRRQALDLLRRARPGENITQGIYRFEYLADLYLRQGNRQQAVATLQESLNHRSGAWLAFWWMRNELRLAELYHEGGRDEDARPLEAEMDRYLVAADPDFPLLVRLKALEARTVPAPPTGVSFKARDWVLVSTFENRTGESQFDRAIEHALEYELANSTYVNIVPPSRIEDGLQLMRRSPETPVTAAVAREVALRDGSVRLVLGGAIERIGTGYAMTVNVLNPTDGAVVASDREEAAGPGEVQKAVRTLSNWVRLTLGEAPPSVSRDNQQLEKATTPSLQALRLFSDGLRAFNGARLAEARVLFTSALNSDPTFASAHVWLGWTLANLKKSPEEYVPSLQRAMDLAGTASEREREWIAGSFYVLTHRDDMALGAFEAMVRRYPDDFWAAKNLIDIYIRTGRRDEVTDLAARVASAQPYNFTIQAQAAMWLLQQNGLAAARPRVARARQILPAADDNSDAWKTRAKIWVLLFPAHDLWARGQGAAAARVLDSQSHRPEYAADRVWTLNMVGKLRLALGQVRLAEEAYRQIDEPDERALNLAEVALARDDRPGIAAQLGAYNANDFSAVSLLIRAGELEQASKVLPTIVGSTGIEQHRAWSADEIEEARGNRARIKIALEAGAPWAAAMTGGRTFMYSETLARAAASIGERAKAIRILEDTAAVGPRAFAFFTQSGFYWMRDQKLLADLYREDGRLDKARAIERDLLARLAVADPDYPLLVELKQRAERRQ